MLDVSLMRAICRERVEAKGIPRMQIILTPAQSEKWDYLGGLHTMKDLFSLHISLVACSKHVDIENLAA